MVCVFLTSESVSQVDSKLKKERRKEKRAKGERERENKGCARQSQWFNYFNYHPLSAFLKKGPLKDAHLG